VLFVLPFHGYYLHHEQQRVQHDQQHDEIFKGRRHDNPPDFVFETVPSAWHVPLQRPRTDCEIDAGFLQPIVQTIAKLAFVFFFSRNTNLDKLLDTLTNEFACY
jgi:hypothetical protein